MHFNGLSDKEAAASREKYGSNLIPDSEPTTFWAEFKETFGDPMIRILLAIAVLMIVMWALGYADIYEPDPAGHRSHDDRHVGIQLRGYL